MGAKGSRSEAWYLEGQAYKEGPSISHGTGQMVKGTMGTWGPKSTCLSWTTAGASHWSPALPCAAIATLGFKEGLHWGGA